ncbi:MAG: ribbon-helix-helix protein, CopG family [Candidatus Lokiarchaeota archaeon]|nr:ribbon-helix-helix protein, CopG family [Candidatus Lokiarchaeota archaeon]
MTTLPIKLKKEIIEKIDYLVKIGRYPNRSAAIREIIYEKLANENFLWEETLINRKKIEDMLNNLKKIKDFQIIFTSDKTANELVSEGRER